MRPFDRLRDRVADPRGLPGTRCWGRGYDGAVPAPVIVASDLTKKYKDFAAVDGISFEVAPGESFGLLSRTRSRRRSTTCPAA